MVMDRQVDGIGGGPNLKSLCLGQDKSLLAWLLNYSILETKRPACLSQTKRKFSLASEVKSSVVEIWLTFLIFFVVVCRSIESHLLSRRVFNLFWKLKEFFCCPSLMEYIKTQMVAASLNLNCAHGKVVFLVHDIMTQVWSWLGMDSRKPKSIFIKDAEWKGFHLVLNSRNRLACHSLFYCQGLPSTLFRLWTYLSYLLRL